MVSLDIIVICEFDSRNSNLQRVLLPKELLRYGRNTPSNFIIGNYNLGGGLRKDPRTLWVDSFDHDLLVMILKSSHQELSNEGSN